MTVTNVAAIFALKCHENYVYVYDTIIIIIIIIIVITMF